MPFQVANKYGGRKLGAVLSRRRDLEEYLEDTNFNVLEEFTAFIRDGKNPVTLRFQGLCELMRYLYPRMKPTEDISVEAGVQITLVQAYAQAKQFIVDMEAQGLLDGKSGPE
ncbi:MAG: hypothetical protein ACRD98_00490 [Nitrososphaera sp.]